MKYEAQEIKSEILGLDVSHSPAASEAARRTTEMARVVARHQFEIFETELPHRLSHLTQLHLERYLSLAWLHPNYECIKRIDTISMLHSDVLTLLWLLTLATPGPVLEIGPYVGGSTIAIGHGLEASNAPSRRVVSVEMGGSYEDHPQVPSKNIVADLKSNIAREGVDHRVDLVVGNSRDASVVEFARSASANQKFGLAFIDSDGNIGGDWDVYGELLRPDCIVVLDDYVADLAKDKAASVKPWADTMVSEGRLRPLGVFGWGTWFGQMVPQ